METVNSGSPPPLPQTPAVPARPPRSQTISRKLLLLGVLTGVLWIGLMFIDNTRAERHARYRAAVDDIAAGWGRSQQVVGPVLVVPFTYETDERVTVSVAGRPTTQNQRVKRRSEAFFLPTTLTADGRLDPTVRARGIYQADVYAAELHLSGRFSRPDLSFIKLAAVTPQWAEARVYVSASDLRGTPKGVVLRWCETGLAMQAQPGPEVGSTQLFAPVDLTAAAPTFEFAVDLALRGSGRLLVTPSADTSRLTLSSTWPDPSFSGATLPGLREVSEAGFQAEWQVSPYGRNLPMQWHSGAGGVEVKAADFAAAAVGVSLLRPVNPYRMVERSIKFGLLFVALVFGTFFVFEVSAGARLNPLNYLLVGAALALFFLGELALAELVRFPLAYGLAAATAVGMIGLYGVRVLESWRRAGAVTGLLSGVFAYLYLVLQEEDYALLAGTAACFAVLAAAMYFTRNVRFGETLRLNEPATS